MHKKNLPQLGRRSRGATQIVQAKLALISYLLKDGFTASCKEFPPTIPSLGAIDNYYFLSSHYFINYNIQYTRKKCKYTLSKINIQNIFLPQFLDIIRKIRALYSTVDMLWRKM